MIENLQKMTFEDFSRELTAIGGQCGQAKFGRVYRPMFDVFLQAEADGTRLSIDDIRRKVPGISSDAVATSAIDSLVPIAPSLLACLSDYLPSKTAMLAALESMDGAITGERLTQFNRRCHSIVDEVIDRRYEIFLSGTLAGRLRDGNVVIDLPSLKRYLREEFHEFYTSQANGLVTRAGGYNEGLIERSLENAGFESGKDYDKTGSKTVADFQIRSSRKKGAAETLYVEVKSYGARERLVRALQDVKGDVVGVGFFNRPDEFNESRTAQFVQSGAYAVYLPDDTFDSVSKKSRLKQNSSGTPFLRRLSSFVEDMGKFRKQGIASFKE